MASGAHDQVEFDPPFYHEGEFIYLKCFGDSGESFGDLRIATASAEVHASTLVHAANAGMRFMRNVVTERAITKILDESGGNGDTGRPDGGEVS